MGQPTHDEIATTTEGLLLYCTRCGRILGVREVPRGDLFRTDAAERVCDLGGIEFTT